MENPKHHVVAGRITYVIKHSSYYDTEIFHSHIKNYKNKNCFNMLRMINDFSFVCLTHIG